MMACCSKTFHHFLDFFISKKFKSKPIKTLEEENGTKTKIPRILNWAVMLIITAVMVFDRYFTEAVMPLIEDEYGIDIKKTALVDGLFALGFTILAISPVFRYFGDWLSQKTIMCIGMTGWTLLTFTFCFVPKQWFWLILLLRGLLDILADFFLSCALPLIGHMFSVSNRRLAIFGSQLCSFLFRLIAICIAALVANQFSWHVARLIAPCLGVICLSLLLVFMKDPSGGNTEEEDEDDEPQVECSLFSCLKPLLTWSFALIMIGSLSVDFIHEGMFAVIPDFLDRTRNETGKQWPLFLSQSYYSDFMIYSAIKCAADVLGMLLGMEISKLLSKEPHSADPWVCAVGLFAFTPIFSLFLFFIKDGIVLPCVFLFISGVFLSLNQALSEDMMLSVIRPKFYTIAGQLQAFLTRLIAGVGAPFIIEYISVKIQESNSEKTSFECMQFALMLLTVVAVIGGTCFLCLNLSFKKDREAADKNATPRQSDVEKSLFTVQRGIERYRGQRIEREELEVGEGGKKGLGSWEKSSPLPHLPQLSPPSPPQQHSETKAGAP